MLQTSIAQSDEYTHTIYFKIDDFPTYKTDGIPYRVFIRMTCSKDFAIRYAYYLIYHAKKIPIGNHSIENIWYSIDNINFIIIDVETYKLIGPTAEEITDLQLDISPTLKHKTLKASLLFLKYKSLKISHLFLKFKMTKMQINHYHQSITRYSDQKKTRILIY